MDISIDCMAARKSAIVISYYWHATRLSVTFYVRSKTFWHNVRLAVFITTLYCLKCSTEAEIFAQIAIY